MENAKVLVSKDEAINLAVEIERVESALKLMKTQLKSFVDAYGSVDTGEKTWGYTESERWKIESAGLKKLAENIVIDGRNPWEYLSITPANLSKLDLSEEMLSSLGTKSTRNSFRGLVNKK